ncbi:hypothetical protein RRG08_050973 [Elysia crispata]|uniref:EGF-like domain-containing protein n=1 Tax=Elysia crispata TaxID=231223 RepID=A0AAE1B1V7_9GAST|nr:hypothetical protein RRG08_050973 [Elysia crispata]
MWPPTRVQQTVRVTIQTAATSVGVTMAINGAQTGFVKVGGAAEILPNNDECDDPVTYPCLTNSVCKNTDGSYFCECVDGYQEDTNGTCHDIDECKVPLLYECPALSNCNNTAGGYTCLCVDGYYKNVDNVCQDINECGDPSRHTCPANSECSNTYGSYFCECLTGYRVDVSGVCQDIDECVETSDGLCPNDTVCSNTDGGFSCNIPQKNDVSSTKRATVVSIARCPVIPNKLFDAPTSLAQSTFSPPSAY